MIWVTWRQHRGEAVAAGFVLAFLGLYLLVSGIQIHVASEALSDTKGPQAIAFADFNQRFSSLGILTKYVLMVLPAILGVFVGAPLLARELDQRTHLFAWAQSVTRARWFLVKIVFLSGAVLISAASLSLIVGWWHSPLDQLFGEGRWMFFDTIGVVPLAYALFAFAVGVALGTILGRTVPAMAVTVAFFTAVRVAFSLLRPWYIAPAVKELALGQSFPQGALPINLHWVDAGSRPLSDDRITQILQQAFPDQATHFGQPGQAIPASATQVAQMSQYLHDHGYRYLGVFQPDDRFWTFQFIEAGIFIALAVTLLMLSAWWLDRRSA
jgi:hypothetical protein